MKTEKEFSDFFLNSYGNHVDSEIQRISLSYWSDLTSHLSFYFSNEDRLAITEMAAQHLRRLTQNQSADEAWKNVLLDFNQNQYWGFQQQTTKPAVKQTEDQKIFWKLFKYAWAFFQSMIILKIAVYYFGLESAEHPDQTSIMWVWVFFGLSASSLVFFAYRNRHDQN